MPTPSTAGVVIVTHGQLATELLNATEMIVGDLPHFTALAIGWHDDVTAAREAMKEAAGRLDTGAGVLLVTDMFGGTPANLALSLVDVGRVEVITGVNLPMLITLARHSRGTSDLTELARKVCQSGKEAIRMASDLLRSTRDIPPGKPA